MGRNLEPFPVDRDTKTIIFKVNAVDYEKIEAAINKKEAETGYTVSLQEIMVDMIRRFADE